VTGIDWAERALRSEVEYSKARGGITVEYPEFTHIYNRFVPWGGDWNRAVRVKLVDFDSFERVVRKLRQVHLEHKLDPPDRLDVQPPPLDEADWSEYLAGMDGRVHTVVFFAAGALPGPMPDGFELYRPSKDEYSKWYRRQVEAFDWFDEEWFAVSMPLQLNFIKVFRPYWLLKDGQRVGWAYCANLGDFCRLFEVEIEESRRGQGLGTLLMQAIRIEAGRLGVDYVLLQAGEKLRSFYEQAGFTECTRNSVIRLGQPWLKRPDPGREPAPEGAPAAIQRAMDL
jgi:GNAT superfamily N-acetyltransferase